MGGRYVPSLLAAIGEVIERHMIEIGFLAAPGHLTEPEREAQVVNLIPGTSGMRRCPKCSAPTLIKQEGCDSCTSCGYSKCG
jgi:ribonucleoside-diphosphate reductase alpha chain